MVYNVYKTRYCNVKTITTYDMQSKDTDVNCIMWRKLNKFMKKNGIEKPNFRGFIVNIVQVDWNVVYIVYGTSNLKVPMENKERTYLLH
jgi:hypothetical protein